MNKAELVNFIEKSTDFTTEEVPLLTFVISDTVIHTTISPLKNKGDSEFQNPVVIKLYPESANGGPGELQGEIAGDVTVRSNSPREFQFHSFALINYKIDPDKYEPSKLPGHISGLISVTIKQLLVSGLISEWYSSGALTKGARRMYHELAADPRLQVLEIPVYEKYDGSIITGFVITCAKPLVA